MPVKFEVAETGSCIFNAVFLELDENTGKCLRIESIFKTI
jgi:calcineurin-like phosphoesterase